MKVCFLSALNAWEFFLLGKIKIDGYQIFETVRKNSEGGAGGMAIVIENNLKEKGYNVPVIDPIPLAVNSAYVLAKLKLSQSKKCYPYPPEKGMVGFEKPKLKIAN